MLVVQNMLEKGIVPKDKFASETKTPNKIKLSGKQPQKKSTNKLVITSEMVIDILII